jgi:hypothetical protein
MNTGSALTSETGSTVPMADAILPNAPAPRNHPELRWQSEFMEVFFEKGNWNS